MVGFLPQIKLSEPATYHWVDMSLCRRAGSKPIPIGSLAFRLEVCRAAGRLLACLAYYLSGHFQTIELSLHGCFFKSYRCQIQMVGPSVFLQDLWLRYSATLRF